ncbi:hypothetical protein GCM10027048_24930 [Hymenobacter coalescens]
MLAALCLLAGGAHAQAALIVNAVRAATNVALIATADQQYFRKGKGSFQLRDSLNWQPWTAVYLTNNGLRAGSGKAEKAYALPEFRQVVLGRDTFAVVEHVRFPAPTKAGAPPIPPTTVLGRLMWRRP